MPGQRLWLWLAGPIVVLALAVVGLDQWQVRQGGASLFTFAGGPPARGRSLALPPRQVTPPRITVGPRIAVIVDDLGARRDVFEAVREIGRPISVAVRPDLALSGWMAGEAARAGLEVLVDLPMEPYRFPEVDPGPGALLMAMPDAQISRRVERHLAAMPWATGVTNHLGSRMTEDRRRMRAALEPLVGRRMFFVDAMTSNLSVGYDQAKGLGLRAGRRHLLIDHAAGEHGDRQTWEAVGDHAQARGEVIVVAHEHPLTPRLLKEYIPRWEAQGARLVPVSHLAR